MLESRRRMMPRLYASLLAITSIASTASKILRGEKVRNHSPRSSKCNKDIKDKWISFPPPLFKN